ncbi:hypothetical protein [Paenibacillus sp. J22TS3]|uniref:hypothetical protein n=1 Tax=Paenibacillus sp. J22TS3 TaxID=2807192 RepID=UPI001B06058C|nr:hypothetical protein [Paenibacillus sp. J22TS3]GIP24661.1 hypothetical protein J22TS3_49360 [Paenibacillus sp. J22TS3]
MTSSFKTKLATAFLTPIMFSLMAGLYFANETYDFSFYFMVVLIYSCLPILLIGLSFSVAMGALYNRLNIRSKALQLITVILAYAAAGFLGTCIYCAAVTLPGGVDWNWEDVRSLSAFGITASLLLATIEYMLSLLSILKRKRGN